MPVEIQQFEVINDMPAAASTPPPEQSSSSTPSELTGQLKKWHREAGVRHDRLRAD
jgi:hypothetical protein